MSVMIMGKPAAKVWTFKSDSNPNKSYESVLYVDGTTSCGCPGWTRRVASDGSRTCKHTRLIDQGVADSNCVASHDYEGTQEPAQKPAQHIQTPTKAKLKPAPARKIQWQ
jgi:hypothetical protein